MNIIYVLLLVLIIVVALLFRMMSPTTVSGSAESNIDELYQHYLSVKELEGIVDEYSNPYELHNILERYLMTSFPDLESEKASSQMVKELALKHLPATIHDRVLKIVRKDQKLGPRKLSKKAIGNMIELQYGDFKFQTPKYRFAILSKQGKLKDIMKSALVLASLMPSSQQWAIPLSEYKKYIEQGATIEGFASPFNSQIMRIDSNLNYCSLSEYDEIFGSLGNFFDQDFDGKTVVVNTPFIEAIQKQAAEKCLSELESHPCKFIFYGPDWNDADFYQLLDKSPYKISKRVLPKYKHDVEDLIKGEKIKAKFGAVVFILERT